MKVKVVRVCGMIALCLLSGCASMRTATDRKELADIYAEKGIGYYGLGEYDLARADLLHALDLDERNAKAHNGLGVLYAHIGRHEAAEREFRRALALAPDDPSIKTNYGRFLCRRGRYEKGLSLLKQAVDDPFYRRAWKASAAAGECEMARKRLDRAEFWFRRTLDKAPPPFVKRRALYWLYTIYREKGDAMKAQAFWERWRDAGGLENGEVVEATHVR